MFPEQEDVSCPARSTGIPGHSLSGREVTESLLEVCCSITPCHSGQPGRDVQDGLPESQSQPSCPTSSAMRTDRFPPDPLLISGSLCHKHMGTKDPALNSETWIVGYGVKLQRPCLLYHITRCLLDVVSLVSCCFSRLTFPIVMSYCVRHCMIQ